MKRVAPPSIESLEPRLFLSADGLTPEAPLGRQASPESEIVEGLQIEMATCSSAGIYTLNLVADGTVVIVSPGDPENQEPVEERWAPFTPTAEQVGIEMRGRVARVHLVVPDSGYRVTDWGTLNHEANRFWVDVQMEKWSGTSENTLTVLTHDYFLGELIENDHCVFSFGVWQQTIESKWFVATNQIYSDMFPWRPSVLTAHEGEVSLIQDGTHTKARVSIRLATLGYSVEDWGTVRQEGDTFVVNIEPMAGGLIQATQWQTVTHEYDLGEVADGNYLFQIRTWGQFFLGTGFSPANAMKPVYRFWSPTHSRHFYTISETERDTLISQWSHFWTYEGVAYYAYEGPTQPDTSAVYRFWSPILGSHFYTMNEAEKDLLIETRPDAWIYEGVAFYAYSLPNQRLGTCGVYRYWSGHSHFYTASEQERDTLADEWSHVWTPEGTAWYVYGL